jgi:hypothetical protein
MFWRSTVLLLSMPGIFVDIIQALFLLCFLTVDCVDQTADNAIGRT